MFKYKTYKTYLFLIIYFYLFYISEQISFFEENEQEKALSQNVNKKEKYNVIIVGAGIAGLSAASLLVRSNISDVLILEASENIGGRISSKSFGNSLIDYGAQWVLGGKGNPVYELSEPYDVLISDDVDDTFDIRSMPKSGVNMNELFDLYDVLYTVFENKTALKLSEGSLADYFNSRLEFHAKEMGVSNKTADAITDLISKLQNAFVGCDNLNDAGILGYSRYTDIDANITYTWKTGYQTFVDIILGKYEGKNLDSLIKKKIKYNKVVQNIDWRGNEVILTCEDETKYFADHVIITVSLGVLKHAMKFMFTPPLPFYKLLAIESIGMGTVEKIFLKFSNSWWNEDGIDLSFIWTAEEKYNYSLHSNHGTWPIGILGFHYILTEPDVLEGWIVGEAAREMENFSDKIVSDVCIDLLKKFMPEAVVPEPINITRTHWHTDRFFRGSYSFATVKSDSLNLSAVDLAQPINNTQNIPVLLFAGEATHAKYFATVHGAVESGWREALRILQIKNISVVDILND